MPKCQVCYFQIKFGDWSRKRNSGDLVPIGANRVFPQEMGFILLTREVVQSKCGT